MHQWVEIRHGQFALTLCIARCVRCSNWARGVCNVLFLGFVDVFWLCVALVVCSVALPLRWSLWSAVVMNWAGAMRVVILLRCFASFAARGSTPSRIRISSGYGFAIICVLVHIEFRHTP